MNPNPRIKRIEKAITRLTPPAAPRLVISKDYRDGAEVETVSLVYPQGRRVVLKVLKGVSWDDI